MFKIPQNIEYIIDHLTQNGYEAYIVGGCVRDLLLGHTPNDFDITTSAKPEEIISLFPKCIPTGLKHGTVTVIVDNTPAEVTTFRTEGSYTDNRRPDSVEFVCDLKQDLARRDFTVNAMAYNHTLGIIDCFGGKADLENKILRAVGVPKKRFCEDALRILRLFRFAATLNFDIEQVTLTHALDCADLLQNVSRERIFTELKKSVIGENFKIFTTLINSGALEFLGISSLPDFEKIKAYGANLLLCLYSFINTESLYKLKPSNKEKEYFKTLDTLQKLPIPQTQADIKEMLNIADSDIVKDYFTLENLNHAPLNQVLQSGEPYKISHLKITGSELLSLGYKGEQVGAVLEQLRRTVIQNPQKNNKQDLLKEIT